MKVLLIFVFIFGLEGQFYWLMKLCDPLFYWCKQSLTHFFIKFQTALKVLIVLIFLYMFFFLLKGPAKIRISRLTHEAQKMIVPGKITNLFRTDSKVLKYVFSLPSGICIYNLIQTGVCVCVSIYIIESLHFLGNVHIYIKLLVYVKVCNVNFIYVFICNQNNL